VRSLKIARHIHDPAAGKRLAPNLQPAAPQAAEKLDPERVLVA